MPVRSGDGNQMPYLLFVSSTFRFPIRMPIANIKPAAMPPITSNRGHVILFRQRYASDKMMSTPAMKTYLIYLQR